MASRKTKAKAPARSVKPAKAAARKTAAKKKTPARAAAAAKARPATRPKVAKPVPKAAPKPNLKPLKSPEDVHLLVVDDEPEILNLLVPFLKKRGYNVSEAEDGDQALEKILTDRPHIVLLDVMMPGLSGWEISQYVRDRPELDRVRIIMATGIGDETNAATAPLYGADAYVDKPFRLDELAETVEHVLGRMEAGAL